jgi:hypothetical protein
MGCGNYLYIYICVITVHCMRLLPKECRMTLPGSRIPLIGPCTLHGDLVCALLLEQLSALESCRQKVFLGDVREGERSALAPKTLTMISKFLLLYCGGSHRVCIIINFWTKLISNGDQVRTMWRKGPGQTMTRFGLGFNLLNDPPESRSIAACPEFNQNVGLLLLAPVQLG